MSEKGGFSGRVMQGPCGGRGEGGGVQRPAHRAGSGATARVGKGGGGSSRDHKDGGWGEREGAGAGTDLGPNWG